MRLEKQKPLKKSSKTSKDDENEALRSNCQKLLKSLKQHQNVLLESVSKLNESQLINEQLNNQKSQPKTVSFSDYLRTSSNCLSPRRRARSVSPHSASFLNIPCKSILKKISIQEECRNEVENSQINHDDYLSSSPSDDESVTRSMSNIYADLGIDDDFEEKIQHIIKFTDLKADSNTLNKKSLIDYISKKRQKYLSYNYNDSLLSNSNSNLNHENVIIETNCFFNKNIKKEEEIPVKVIHKRRSKSADNISNLRKNSRESSNERNKNSNKSYAKPTLSSLNNITKSKTKEAKTKNQKFKNYKKIAKKAKKDQPLLGFDWALDAIDTKHDVTITKFSKPDEYWEELSNFRSQNSDECVSSKPVNFNGTITSFIEYDGNSFVKYNNENDDNDGRNHKCIHSYTLNERLFPVPVYKDKNGQSLCPVCKSTRKEANSFSPQFCKISIPKSKIIEQVLIEPNIRSNISSEDTLSLAEHCMAGYQATEKNKVPTKSKTVDLKSSTTNVNTMSKLSFADLKRIESNKDPATSTIYNKAHAMRYELEDQHQKRLRELMPKFNNL